MYLKKETKLIPCRKLKKKVARKNNVFLWNSNFYSLGTKYNSVTYLFKRYNINLNIKITSDLLKEELGFIFSLNNLIILFYKKMY